MFNPFPGLRPFEADEDHLFFGRESEVDELLRRLRTTRLLAVVGTSGSGKSSLVRSGLIPALQSGFMVGASSSWRMAVCRPGEDPIGHLAGALAAQGVLDLEGDNADPDVASTSRVLIEATLRRGSLGLAQAVKQARIPSDENVLVLVDQFEELFRFRRSHQIANSRDEAIAFVRLLLEAARQRELPIFVALTMRSDFIGDCMDFPGLPEAVNEGLYLVGRMSRDALRSAITGPVAVAGGTIAPRLVHRLLNELGDDHDQLPVVQHALMRTWDRWARRTQGHEGDTGQVRRAGRAGQAGQAGQVGDEPVDIDDYEAIGTMRNALSLHAEKAYQEAVSAGGGRVVEQMFKALTDTVSDQRGVRRPTPVQELAAISAVPESEVIRMVEIFRRPGRSFLMPPPSVPLTGRSIIDISHESLMRNWTRLIAWAYEERASAEFYGRLAQAASWSAAGSAGLWRNPELGLAIKWKRENEPTAAWAKRYHREFDSAMAFLDASIEEHDRVRAEQERERQAKLRRVQWAAGVLGVFLIVAATLASWAIRERNRAEGNLTLARQAVDESLSSAERDPARLAGDTPDVQELRRELLMKAETFYAAFMDQAPRSQQARKDVAEADLRLGHIDRMLEKRDEAERHYEQAIAAYADLARDYPGNAEYRAQQANAFNWLGETLRPQPTRSADAARAYDSAHEIQRALADQQPDNTRYRAELARTHYNRGILRALRLGDAAGSEADFRDAIQLLEPLAGGDTRAAQELARVYNNLGSLLSADPSRTAEVRRLFEQAIEVDEQLAQKDPANREYKMELAKYYNNLAGLLYEEGEVALANERSGQALELIETLARLAPSLAVERADAHSMRGMMLAAEDAVAAEREYREALELFEDLQNDPALRRLPDFHLRFGDFLLNLAAFARERTGPAGDPLLARAVRSYAEVVKAAAASGGGEVSLALDTVSRVAPELPERERRVLAAAAEPLQRRLTTR